MQFLDEQLSLTILAKSYNPYLVVISVLIAIVASFTAFGASERIFASKTNKPQLFWNLFGATTMGIGIWTMHFVASLALILPIPVTYNLSITLISVVPAILSSSVVLWLMNQTFYSFYRLLFCGLLLGAGIGTMHYTGMAAMEMNADLYYEKYLFLLSLIVAVLLATLALKIQYEASDQASYQFFNTKKYFSSIVMGMAITAMHYTAMKAAVFVVPVLDKNAPETAIDTTILAMMLSAVVFLILLLAIVIPHMLRYMELSADLARKEESLRVAATAFQTHEAIMVTNANAEIIRVNAAFTELYGYTETEVIGKNPRIFKSGRHDGIFYKNFWNSLQTSGTWCGEIWNKWKDGSIFPTWQTISAVKNEKKEVTHYVAFFSGITDLKISKKEINKLAFYDPLTNLPNRRLLYERLGYELINAKRYLRTGALLFLDLDRFKNINDSLGHSVGDILLVETAQRLQSILRKSDTAVRLGGDEFIVLISAQNKTNSELVKQAQVIAEKIIRKINRPYFVVDHKLYISPSIGIVLFNGEDEGADMLLKRADTAMYRAKEAGGNTFRFYRENMQKIADEKWMLEKNIRIAIENKEFELHYQPQFSEDGIIIGAEALIRWNHPELGMISPGTFIPVAEETGLILDIGEWVIQTASQQIHEWDQQGIKVPHIAINISPRQFHQEDFVAMLERITAFNKIKPARMLLEITESVFLKHEAITINKMNSLRQKGFNFSIDDFGTGYSSLTYLQRLPFNQLKIDQSFISDMINDANGAAIVKAIIFMTNTIGLDLIAEGVETDKQLAVLLDYGCRCFQGYYFSRPLPADQFYTYYIDHTRDSLKNAVTRT